jgi:hypothetical protein
MTVVDDGVRFSLDLRTGERVDHLPDLAREPVTPASYQEPFDLAWWAWNWRAPAS